MNHVCPSCGHTFTAPADAQIAGGKLRWRGVSKAKRTAAARAAARARWAKYRANHPR